MSEFDKQKNILALKYNFVDWNDMLKAIHNGTFNKSVQSLYEEICEYFLNTKEEYYKELLNNENYIDAHLCINLNEKGYLLKVKKGSYILCSQCYHLTNLNFRILKDDFKNIDEILITSNIKIFKDSLQHILDSGLNEIRIQEFINNIK